MILVTGATGTIGREVVKALLARGDTTPGETVRAMTRNPRPGATPPGVHVVYGDFDRPDTLPTAAEGVRALFLLSAPGPTQPAHDLAMLAAAGKAGIEQVVKISAIGTNDASDTTSTNTTRLGRWHEPGEDAARHSGLAWTILRPTTFASNALSWADPIRSGRPVPNIYGAGTQGVIDPADIAAVAVAALTNPGDSATYTLTGPELISVPEQAAQLGEILGRTIDIVDVEPERAGELMTDLSAELAGVAMRGAAYVRDGHNAVVTDDVARLLGRPPRTFRQWAERHREQFS